jgi:hypothetical protein
MPGSANSARMIKDAMDPSNPKAMAKMMYIVPMSLWFVEYAQRRQPVGWPCESCVLE